MSQKRFRFKVCEYQLNSIKRMLSLSEVLTEHKLCMKYGVDDLEELYATDYEEIVEEIQKNMNHRIKATARELLS